MSITNIIYTTLFVIMLTSCSTPYYGYTESDWEKLNDAEKKAARSEYKEVIDAKNAQKHRDTMDDIKDSVIDRGVNGYR